MPRRFFKRYMPHPDRIKGNKSLRFLGALIHDSNLWHLNRHSVSRAMAIGLFWAMIPMPMQMLASALCAIPARANLPIAIGLVWLTNPLTMPPVFYCNYKVGAWLMDTPAMAMPEHLTLAWVAQMLNTHATALSRLAGHGDRLRRARLQPHPGLLALVGGSQLAQAATQPPLSFASDHS